jgi:hypothetical protein
MHTRTLAHGYSAAAAWLAASAAIASPITYTITGIATGRFAGHPFSDAAYSISMTADTSNIVNLGGGVYTIVATAARVEFPGIGAVGSFTNRIQFAANQPSSIAGFGDLDQDLAIAFVANPALSGYALATPIGPLSGVGPFNPGAAFPTTAGDFELDSISTASFTAQVTPPCYPNCDHSTTAPILNIADFVCFQSKFAGGDSYANCDGSTQPPVLNISDFVCFQQAFAAGCP